MEEGVLSPGKMLGSLSDTSMDFEYMDELLLDGCWLETAVGSEFLNLSPSNSADLFDSSLLWPISETNDAEMTLSTSNKDTEQVEKVSSSLPGNMSLNDPPVRNLRNSQSLGHVSGVSAREDGESEGSELNRRWWIGPRAMPGYGTSVAERLMRALWYMKQAIKEKDVLIQIWVPENRGGKRVLRTHDDLFALDPSCWKLASYREVSANYQFLAEEDSKDLAGLPGRVFLGKVPEWTPDVRFFKSDEYPRVDHAQRCEVSGTLALPVFEQGSRNCLGVIEVVTTEQKIKYRPELENVCKALEAVDLRSSEVLSMQNVKECDTSYKAALPEIQELLRSACEMHRLPLAQTWVPCIWQGKGGCRHSDENYVHCVSTVDRACHVVDPGIQPFHEACSEHHLLKGQGVAGGAFLTNQPCFSSDITLFSKTEYPLAHHAKVFKLCAAVAIRLRSLHTGKVDFVLEFFLPVDCRDPEEQKKMLASLSIVIQRVCHTLRVVTNKELEEETGSSLNEVLITSDSRPSAEMNQPELYPRGDGQSLKELKQKRDIASTYQAEKPEEQLGKKSADCRKEQKANTLEGECGEKCAHVDVDKMGEKRRTKAEKTISLEVLRQYFAGSLKDAAKNIGVCPTTLKRICRRHGIQRWPSRKIKKVGHSLQKIQHVIDSVQGTSGAVQIGSFYKTFPALAYSSTSRASPLSTLEPTDHPRPSGPQPERGIFNSQLGPPTSPSSSCSQSSSSSHSCSSGTHQHQSALMFSAYVDSMLKDLPVDGVLKRVRSNSELHSSSQERTKLMPRSLSHKSLIEQLDSRNPASLPENGSHSSPKIDSHRVKVTYGGENIRFRMPNSWGFRDLEQEVARRFNIGDMSKFVLKYLDDDLEWILITCDDDLQECTDVCGSSKTSIIRLMLQVSASTSRNLVSNGPS